MRIIRGAVAAAAVLAVAGCGASESAQQAADASAVETVFRSYTSPCWPATSRPRASSTPRRPAPSW